MLNQALLVILYFISYIHAEIFISCKWNFFSVRKSYSEEIHVKYDSAGISFRRAHNPSSAVAHPIGRFSLSLTFRTSKNFLGVEHGVHASEEKEKKKGPNRFPSDFEESWSFCRVRCPCISDYLVENRGTRLQLKALDMRKGRESFAGETREEIYRRCQRRGSMRGRGRGRVRSLSPVQTFTSYETTGELPVLGTGCRWFSIVPACVVGVVVRHNVSTQRWWRTTIDFVMIKGYPTLFQYLDISVKLIDIAELCAAQYMQE